VFWGKMSLLALILLLEIRPIVSFTRLRMRGRDAVIDAAAAATVSRISFVQAVLVVLMVFAATAMARGIGS
jgi:putative membrane protein